jgi:SHS family lactate transporter-like MFS transporter
MQVLFAIPVIYNIGAIVGALYFGHLSEKIGRRRAAMLALTLSLISIPAWAFGSSLLVLALGSYFMQTGVQGTFGVIPAHLNELSPDAVRSLFPGFVYQLGVLIASPAVTFEYILRDHFGYPWALTAFELCVIVSLLFIFGFGPERHGRSFHVGQGSLAASGETKEHAALEKT